MMAGARPRHHPRVGERRPNYFRFLLFGGLLALFFLYFYQIFALASTLFSLLRGIVTTIFYLVRGFIRVGGNALVRAKVGVFEFGIPRLQNFVETSQLPIILLFLVKFSFPSIWKRIRFAAVAGGVYWDPTPAGKIHYIVLSLGPRSRPHHALAAVGAHAFILAKQENFSFSAFLSALHPSNWPSFLPSISTWISDEYLDNAKKFVFASFCIGILGFIIANRGIIKVVGSQIFRRIRYQFCSSRKGRADQDEIHPPPPRSQNPHKGTCPFCIEEQEDLPISCSRGHRICATCFDQALQSELNEALIERKRIDLRHIATCRCLVSGESSAAGQTTTLCQEPYNLNFYTSYLSVQTRILLSKVPQKGGGGKSYVTVSEALISIHGKSKVRMCPNCHAGPFLNEACSNLLSHHGQESSRSFLDNSCSNCGYFNPDWSKWETYPEKIEKDVKKTPRSKKGNDNHNNIMQRDLLSDFLRRRVAKKES